MRQLTSTSTNSRQARPTKLLALCVSAALFALAATSASAALTLVNGSLTGPIANDGVPAGWTISVHSPDTIDTTHNQGVTVYPFATTPSFSPDGGTWVGIGTTTNPPFPTSTVEAFGQTVSGFTVGNSYTLKWYHANFGLTAPGFPQYTATGANSIELLADGISVGSGSVLALGPDWIEDSVTFVAMDTDIDLTFRASNAAIVSYQSIDGIRLTEVPVITPPNAVPEPAALSLFSGAGLAMVLASRRRKQAKQAKQAAV